MLDYYSCNKSTFTLFGGGGVMGLGGEHLRHKCELTPIFHILKNY